MNGINSVQLMPQVNPYYQMVQPLAIMQQKPEAQVSRDVLSPYSYKQSSVPVGATFYSLIKDKNSDAVKRAEETEIKAKKLAEEGNAFRIKAEAYGDAVLKKADALKGEVAALFSNSANKVPENGAPVTISKDDENDVLIMTEHAENGSVKRVSHFKIWSNALELDQIEEYSNGLANIYRFKTPDNGTTELSMYIEGAREGKKPNSIDFEKRIDFTKYDEETVVDSLYMSGCMNFNNEPKFGYYEYTHDIDCKVEFEAFHKRSYEYYKDIKTETMPDGTRVRTCGEEVHFTKINDKQNEDDASTSSIQVRKYIKNQKETVLEIDKNSTRTVEIAKELIMNEKGTYGEYRENKRESRLSNGNVFDKTYAHSEKTSEDLKLYYNGDCWAQSPFWS